MCKRAQSLLRSHPFRSGFGMAAFTMPEYMTQWKEQGGHITLAFDQASIADPVRDAFNEAFGFEVNELLETLAEILPEEYEAALGTISIENVPLTIAQKGRLRRVFKMASTYPSCILSLA